MWVHTKKLPPFLASITRKRLSAKSVPLLSTSSSLSSLSSNRDPNAEESCVSGDCLGKNNGAVTTTTDISSSATSIGSVTSLIAKGDNNCCRKRKKDELEPAQLTKRNNNRMRAKLEKTTLKANAVLTDSTFLMSHNPGVTSSSISINKKENTPPNPHENRFRSRRINNKCASSISLCVDACAGPFMNNRPGSICAGNETIESVIMRRPRKSNDFGKQLRQSSASSRNLTYDDVQIRELKKKMRDVINRPERNVFMGLL